MNQFVILLPLEHSEDWEDQKLGVSLLLSLLSTVAVIDEGLSDYEIVKRLEFSKRLTTAFLEVSARRYVDFWPSPRPKTTFIHSYFSSPVADQLLIYCLSSSLIPPPACTGDCQVLAISPPKPCFGKADNA